MRCFVACFPSPAARDALAALAAALSGLGSVRRVPADNYHLTLRFLGEVDADAARAAARDVAALPGSGTTAGRLLDLSGFPRPERARVVVVRLVPDARLTAWHGQLAHLPGKSEPGFTPHVTIARSRRGVRVPEAPAFRGVPLDLERPALYRSVGGAGGVRYEVVPPA